MRVVVEQGIEGYRGIYLEVQDWFAQKERITWHVANVIRQTEKAILIKHADNEVWIPKSVVTVHRIKKGLESWLS